MRTWLKTIDGLWLAVVLACRCRFRFGGGYLAWRRRTAFGGGDLSGAEKRRALLQWALWASSMRRLAKRKSRTPGAHAQ